MEFRTWLLGSIFCFCYYDEVFASVVSIVLNRISNILNKLDLAFCKVTNSSIRRILSFVIREHVHHQIILILLRRRARSFRSPSEFIIMNNWRFVFRKANYARLCNELSNISWNLNDGNIKGCLPGTCS